MFTYLTVQSASTNEVVKLSIQSHIYHESTHAGTHTHITKIYQPMSFEDETI